ncbi:MAG: amidohydrolase family protein [Candidatus Rokuibacteriota bacterium]
MSVIDADGHVTETQEQLARYLEEPYRRRPHGFPWVPQDGWDRRLLGTLGDSGRTAEEWLRALDKGGMEFIRVTPRLKAVALLPVQDPQAAATELRRAVRELGHVGGMLAADGGHLLGDERFTPIYEEAQRLGVTSIVFEGVPERFPDLRIAFLEAGCGWAPYWMERMDDEYAKRANRGDLADTQKRKILGDNARRLYRL